MHAEDVAVTNKVKELAKGARTAFIPQARSTPSHTYTCTHTCTSAKRLYLCLTIHMNVCLAKVQWWIGASESKADRPRLKPQCGLAPGFITMAGFNLTKSFDTVHNLRLRVGALPRFPSNALKYNLTWRLVFPLLCVVSPFSAKLNLRSTLQCLHTTLLFFCRHTDLESKVM
jgi:saccharopine dehydrogenase-like NADP-dependent oxidoreductase